MTRNQSDEVKWCKLKKKYDSLVNTTLTKRSKLTSQVRIHTDNMYFLKTSPGWYFQKKPLNSRLIMRKSENPNWVIFYKMPDQYSSRLSRSWKARKQWDMVTDQGRLRRHYDSLQCASLIGTVRWKGSISGKAGGIQIKSRI